MKRNADVDPRNGGRWIAVNAHPKTSNAWPDIVSRNVFVTRIWSELVANVKRSCSAWPMRSTK